MNPTSFLVEFQRCLEARHEYSLSWCQENILGLHDCDLWWMKTLKHSYPLTVSSPSHISSWVLQSSLLGSFLKLGITDLDKDAKHNSKVFNSKTLEERSDMLNKKFKIQRDLDRMECLNKANPIKLKVQYFTKATVSTEVSKLYLAAGKKTCWNWESWNQRHAKSRALYWSRQMRNGKTLPEFNSKLLMMDFPHPHPTARSLTSGKGDHQ